MPLPIVKVGTLASVVHASKSMPFEDYLFELIENIAEKNPLIFQFLERASRGEIDEITPDPIIFVGLMVYRFLESQQEADELEKQIG